MDDLLNKLTATTVGDGTGDGTGYSLLFKNWGRQGKQEDRRKSLLETQKRERNGCIDRSRGILEIVEAVEMEMEWSGKNTTGYRPSNYIPGFHRQRPSYRNTLMFSEWLVEKPEDLDTNWYIMVCPKGTRCIVVAHWGTTKVFNKFGAYLFEFRSMLPGGSPNSRGSRNTNVCCVLDCVYCDKTKDFYVMDLLAWNNQSMTDCDTEFRYFWLHTQFEDSSLLRVVTKKNQMRFELLVKSLCTKENLNKVMSNFPPFSNNCPGVDGLLFYHRETSYTAGKTPLVGWLFPYMVTEILIPDIPLHKDYEAMKPPNYTNQNDFIVKFEEKMAKKHGGRKSRTSSASLENSVNAESETSMQTNEDANPQPTIAEEKSEEAKPEVTIAEEKSDQMEHDDGQQQEKKKNESTLNSITSKKDDDDTT